MTADKGAPNWFLKQLSCKAEVNVAIRNDARIHYLSWGEPSKPGLLFLHGFRAHAHWWDFIAPYFAAEFRVVAPDFSGMGESGHRSSYSNDTFLEDISIVLDHAGMRSAAAVGHSFGGTQLLRACAKLRGRIDRAVIIDSSLNFADDRTFVELPAYTPTLYPTREAALARFRLLPDQPSPLDYTMAHVAAHSLRKVEGGWRWKFDAKVRPSPFQEDAETMLRSIGVPVHYLFAEHSSVVDRKRATRIAGLLNGGRTPILMPDAHHHVLLDHPLLVVGILKALLT